MPVNKNRIFIPLKVPQNLMNSNANSKQHRPTCLKFTQAINDSRFYPFPDKRLLEVGQILLVDICSQRVTHSSSLRQ